MQATFSYLHTCKMAGHLTLSYHSRLEAMCPGAFRFARHAIS